MGRFGADEVVKGYVRPDKTQASLGLTKLVGPRLGASQTTLGGDVAWVHVHDMPDGDEAPLHAVAPPSADSWGYRAVASMTYNHVFGGLTLVPRLVWTHDVHGITPAPVSTFIAGRKSLRLGLAACYIDRCNLSGTDHD